MARGSKARRVNASLVDLIVMMWQNFQTLGFNSPPIQNKQYELVVGYGGFSIEPVLRPKNDLLSKYEAKRAFGTIYRAVQKMSPPAKVELYVREDVSLKSRYPSFSSPGQFEAWADKSREEYFDWFCVVVAK